MTDVYAHTVEGRDRSDWETLEVHSSAVANRAAQFALPFDGAEVAAVLGMIHDVGKMKARFQAKLNGERNDEPHSGEGAKILNNNYPGIGTLLAACVAGHHSGLPDAANLHTRLKATQSIDLPDWMVLPDALRPFGPLNRPNPSHFSIQFATRMLFSCLIDADESETAAFYDAQEGRPISRTPITVTAVHRASFDAHIAQFAQSKGAVNKLRSEILTHVRAQATRKTGLFTLTVPTGGGKTLTALGFALDHALAHGLERIIHVIPYTSIVEQTADVFGKVLGAHNVVEHHSSFDWDAVTDEEDTKRLHRVTRNWDAPVIVTTAVQFFESMFAARKRRCVKLHNLARSVIVIDEAQTIPHKFMRPCLAAISELATHFGATVVLSTATQPVLTREQGLNVPEALQDVRELAPDPKRLYDSLRRTEVTNIGAQDDPALVDRITAAPQILTIVATRAHARSLFDKIAKLSGSAHLSTSMTPQHRRAVLAKIRNRLDQNLPVRVVATSLVEAGVDVDFPIVMRAATGIDAIAQAAGRCNREGRLEVGKVLVFTPTADGAFPKKGETSQMAEIGLKVLGDFAHDPLSEAAVAAYFNALLWSKGADALDAAVVDPQGVAKTGILKEIAECGNKFAFRFEKIAEAFQLIDDAQAPVIVRGGTWGIADDLLNELAWKGAKGGIARALQPYVVNLPHHKRRALEASRAASVWREDLFGRALLVCNHSDLYDDRAGMRMDRFDDLGFLSA